MKREERYHVHGLEGYSKHTYKYVGNYRWFWLARLAASNFITSYLYGQVTITRTKDKPLIT